MPMTRLASLAVVALLLGGCGWLPERETLTAWIPDLTRAPEEGSLERVRTRAPDTPGNQGLLYVALVETEAAAQSAGRAAAEERTLAEVEGALGDLLHALDPARAPDWGAKRAGIVPGWSGSGYGLQRALRAMTVELETAAAMAAPASERRRTLEEALACVANTTRRSDQLAEAALRALQAGGVVEPAALADLRTLAEALARGEGDACGLQQTAVLLRTIRVQPAAS
jgi:hypothetical protein